MLFHYNLLHNLLTTAFITSASKNDSLVTPEWPAVMHLLFGISSADWRMATVAFCRATKRSLIDTNTAGAAAAAAGAMDAAPAACVVGVD